MNKKKKKPFSAHLADNLPFAVGMHALNALVFQEVSAYWAKEAAALLQPGWRMAWQDKKAIMVEEKTWRLVETAAPLIFPGEDVANKRGRRVLCVPSSAFSRGGIMVKGRVPLQGLARKHRFASPRFKSIAMWLNQFGDASYSGWDHSIITSRAL